MALHVAIVTGLSGVCVFVLLHTPSGGSHIYNFAKKQKHSLVYQVVQLILQVLKGSINNLCPTIGRDDT